MNISILTASGGAALLDRGARRCLLMLLAIGTLSCVHSTLAADYYVATNGYDSPTNGGALAYPWRTINYAVNRTNALAGDRILIRGGIYREAVHLTRNLASTNYLYIEAYSNEAPVIKGSEVCTNWTLHTNFIWMTSWPTNTQQVFVDGTPLQQIGWPNDWFLTNVNNGMYAAVGTNVADMTPGSFFYDRSNAVLYIWLADSGSPSGRCVEVSRRRFCLWNDTASTRVWVRGLQFRHSSSVNDSIYWASLVSLGAHGVLEECDVQWGDFGGVFVYSDGKVVRCNVSNCGNTGFNANTCTNIYIGSCTVFSNNYRGFEEPWHAGGMKLIPNVSGVVESNEVAYNYGTGIWLDGCKLGGPLSIRHNYCHHNTHHPRRPGRTWIPGIFIEISRDVECYNNLVVSNHSGIALDHPVNCRVYNNTIVGHATWWGLQVNGSDRANEWTLTNAFYNNLLIDNPMTVTMRGDDAYTWSNRCDYNCYYNTNGTYIFQHTICPNWTNYSTLAAWQQATGYDTHSLVTNPRVQVVAGNWLLSPDSPCIDRGTNVVGLTDDYLGRSRPVDGNHDGVPEVDIGAYELQAFGGTAFWFCRSWLSAKPSCH